MMCVPKCAIRLSTNCNYHCFVVNIIKLSDLPLMMLYTSYPTSGVESGHHSLDAHIIPFTVRSMSCSETSCPVFAVPAMALGTSTCE